MTMTRTTRPRTGRTTYHRDGTVTIWDCMLQAWVRGSDPSDAQYATMSDGGERTRVSRHTAGR
jgi:hypothetical protein